MGEYAEPEFLQEDDTAVKAINKTILNVEKEDADLNSKTRKFSLQELKSQESEVKHANKKRNISLPDLPDSSSVTMRSDGTHSKPTTKQTNALNAATNSEKSVNLKRQNAIDEDRQNGKVSSLRSVLLEVDAYENIEIVNKQSRIRAGVVSMKEQSVNAESKQVPVRRAFSEQTRAPVPKPRTNALLKKRKTFDPYDYPPGVPIPQALLEEDEEVRDSEYIAHDPFAEETNALKRKTFDPYDYPPGFPIPKALLENGEHNEHDQTVNVAGESDNNDTDNTFIESSGVYIAYDPDNNEETNELDENVGGDYINCSDVVFEEDKYNGTQNSLDSKTTEYEQDAAISPFEAHAPPKPCSGPYYVNELVNVFDTETGRQAGITNETDTKSDAYSPTNTSPEIINPNLNDGYALHDDKNILKNYDNILVNGNVSLANNRTDKTAAVTPGTSTTELRSESAHKLSELEGSLPLDAEKDMPQYLSDNDGVYQNLVPPKPPRLHTSLEKLDNNPEHINTNLAGTNNSPPKDNLQDENQESYDYEDVLVMHKRKESEKDVGHGYVNVKRFS